MYLLRVCNNQGDFPVLMPHANLDLIGREEIVHCQLKGFEKDAEKGVIN